VDDQSASGSHRTSIPGRSRLKIHNASQLALAAGVSQVSPSRLVRQVEAGGFLDCFADQLELVRIQDLVEEASCGTQSLQGDLLPLGYSEVMARNNSNPRSMTIKPFNSVRPHARFPATAIHPAFAWDSLLPPNLN
jgi:hypothetical protein